MLSCSLHTKGFSAATAAEISAAQPGDTRFRAWATEGAAALLDRQTTDTHHRASTGGKAYGLSYTVWNLETGEAVPIRLRKEALTDRSIPETCMVACSYVMVDVDNPDHSAWGSRAEAAVALAEFPVPDGLVPFMLHSTEHGIHAWYELDEAVSPADQERIAREVHSILRARGVVTDPNTLDWTRLMSLPRRDLSTYVEEISPGAKIPAKTLLEGSSPVPKPSPPPPTAPVQEAPEVDPDEAFGAAFPSGTPTEPSPFVRAIQARIRGWLTVNEQSSHAPLARAVVDLAGVEPGSRDNAFAISTGWLVSFALREAWRPETCSLEDAYLALVGLVSYVAELTDAESGPQDSGASWSAKALYKLGTYWARDRAAYEAAVALQTSQAPPVPFSPGTEERTLPPILSLGSGFLALQPDGTYSALYGTLQQAVGDTLRTGLADTCGIRYIDRSTAQPKVVSSTTIQQNHLGQATIHEDLVYPTLLDGNQRASRYYPKAMPSDMHVDMVEYGLAIRRNTARFDPWVAAYLAQISRYKQDRRNLFIWLQNFPRWFDRKLPMLLLHGDPRTGKSLLLNGLAALAPSVQLDGSTNSGSYNHAIAEGVTLLWDDTLPVSGHRYSDTLAAIDSVLRLTMGQKVSVRQKYRDDRECQRPWCLVHTYNSLQFANIVFRNLNGPNERARRSAVASRLLAVSVRPESREWILSNPSPYSPEETILAVAQHIQWLCENPQEIEEPGTVEASGNVHLRNDWIDRIAEQCEESTLDQAEQFLSVAMHATTVQGVAQKPVFFFWSDKNGLLLLMKPGLVMRALADVTSTPEMRRDLRYFLDEVSDFDVPENVRGYQVDMGSGRAVDGKVAVKARAVNIKELLRHSEAFSDAGVTKMEALIREFRKLDKTLSVTHPLKT